MAGPFYVTVVGAVPGIPVIAPSPMVTFTPAGWLPDPAAGILFPPNPQYVRIFEGAFSVQLLATDTTDTPWTWEALFNGIPGVTPYSFSFALPSNAAAFTATDASPCVFTASGTAYSDGQPVTLAAGSLPGGFSPATVYYVVSASGDAFSLAATYGGAASPSTSTGSGHAVPVVDISALATIPSITPTSQYTPLPQGDPSLGEVPVVTQASPLALGWGAGGGVVSSVFGRTGAVTAQPGDYSALYDASGAAATAQSNAETYAAAQAAAAQAAAEGASLPLPAGGTYPGGSTDFLRADGQWAAPAGGGSAVDYVTFTVTGTTFSPQVALIADSAATVTWEVEEGWPSAAGLNPTFSFGLAATRHVRMYVTLDGASALGQVAVVNLGFNNTLDEGNYSPPSSYNYAVQPVTAVENVSLLTGLTLFLATGTTLGGLVDFTGCAGLTNAELYGSDVTAVNVTGCASLERLVVEASAVTTADLNPAAASLYEFRAAAQQGDALSLAPLSANLARVYHFCVRDQAVTGLPAMSRLPVVKELWIWNTGISGALAPVSTALTNVQAFSNALTSAAFTAPAFSGNQTYLDLHSNDLASVTLPASNGLSFVDLHNNLLTASQVNAILENLASNSISNGTANLAGTGNAGPTGAGLTAVTTLEGRGWTVTTNAAATIDVSPATLGVAQGQTGTFAVTLPAQPSGNVTVATAFASGNTGLSVTAGASLTFTTSNWATPQNVTITADGSHTGAAVFTSTSSGYNPGSCTVTETVAPANFTHQDTGHNSSASAASLAVTLSQTISAGDLLVVFVETGGGSPGVSDTAGNSWVGVASSQVFYCLDAKASAGTVITATVGSGYIHQMIADRFTPPGPAVYGANAETGSSGTIGLNYNTTGCGDLGTVPAGALAWGAFTCDDGSGSQAYTPGFQTDTTAPADVIGSQFAGANGTGLSVYVLDTVNEDATLTWYGTGTGAIGHAASAYFTA